MLYEDLSWIFLEWRRYQQRRLKKYDITIQQYSLMKVIARAGSMCANEAAQFLHCDKPTLSVIIANLVKKGFMERIPDENDRRKCRLAVTETGLQELKRIQKENGRPRKRPFDVLSREEQEILGGYLALARKNLEEILREEEETEE